jgi:hypothetical protein
MSIYEVLVVAALLAVGGYAYYLYRKDTRPKLDGSEAEIPTYQPLVQRTPPKPPGDAP